MTAAPPSMRQNPSHPERAALGMALRMALRILSPFLT